MLSRFHLIPERNEQTDGRTDGQTDRFAISISRVHMLTRDKNCRLAGQLGRKLIVCLCYQNADIFEVRMNFYWSYMQSFRGLGTQFRSDVVRCRPMWSDVLRCGNYR